MGAQLFTGPEQIVRGAAERARCGRQLPDDVIASQMACIVLAAAINRESFFCLIFFSRFGFSIACSIGRAGANRNPPIAMDRGGN